MRTFLFLTQQQKRKISQKNPPVVGLQLKRIKLLIGIIIMQMIIVRKNFLLDLGKIKI